MDEVGCNPLRGWKEIGEYIDHWESCEGQCLRLLVGMQKPPRDEIRTYYHLMGSEDDLDNQTKLRLTKRLAEEFRDQLTIGVPTNQDEETLRRLACPHWPLDKLDDWGEDIFVPDK
jgi:hypothetical protein